MDVITGRTVVERESRTFYFCKNQVLK